MYCGVCFFELPQRALSLKSTGAIAVDVRRGEDPAPLNDLSGPVQKENVKSDKAPYKEFFLESLQLSQQRGCNTCGALHQAMLRSNPDLSDKPSKCTIRWRDAGLSWEGEQFDNHIDLFVFSGHRPATSGDFDMLLLEHDEAIVSLGKLCLASFDLWPHTDVVLGSTMRVQKSEPGWATKRVPGWLGLLTAHCRKRCWPHPFLDPKASIACPSNLTSSDRALGRLKSWLNGLTWYM